MWLKWPLNSSSLLIGRFETFGGGRIPTAVSNETVAAIDTGTVVASIGDLDDRLGNVFEGSLELRLGDVFGCGDQDRDVPVLDAGERLGVDNLDVDDGRRHGRHPRRRGRDSAGRPLR